MSQTIPNKPAYLSEGEYRYILQRDQHQCALIKWCRDQGRLGQSDYCSTQLHFDHHQPQELGGDDGFANIRLLCEAENCGRAIEPTSYWAARNFWDTELSVKRLRQIQEIAGYDPILDPIATRALTEFRNALLKRITLLPGATGIGKTLLLIATLFAINKVVGIGRPRVRRMLWLATERNLRDLAAVELRTEAYGFGIATERAPSVAVFDSFSDFMRGPGDHDICVSCVQPLWEVKKGDAARRSDDEKRMALEPFDTIVFDEGDWAHDQARSIATLASHALKIGLTASPPFMEGIDPTIAREFAKAFVLISEEAIGDYERANQLDGCLKFIDPEDADGFVLASMHDSYDELVRGVRNTVSDKASLDHVAHIATILQAAHHADQLETAMRERFPDRYFSPHIIVRFDYVRDLKAAYFVLMRILREQGLRNAGWNVTALFEGHMAKSSDLNLDPDCADLSARHADGSYRHPFMRAKNNGGRADETCVRIMLMCKIGVRGINNWPIQFSIDCTESPSVTKEIQFLIGRPIRLPASLGDLLHDPEARQFVTLYAYIPETKGVEAKAETIRLAREFVLDMRAQITGRGLPTWSDIVDGIALDDVPPPEIDPAAPPFTQGDKVRLQALLGAAIEGGTDITDPRSVDYIVSNLDPQPPPNSKRHDQGVQYVIGLRDDPAFVRNEVLAANVAERLLREPVSVLSQLKPQDSYSTEMLRRFVQTDVQFVTRRPSILAALQQDDANVIDLLSKILRKLQQLCYREPPRVWPLQNEKGVAGAVPIIGAELYQQLIGAGAMQDTPSTKRLFWIILNQETAAYFSVKNAEGGGDLDHHGYTVAILGRCRRDLQALTRAMLARRGLLPHIARLI
jgi:hypothetical protein